MTATGQVERRMATITELGLLDGRPDRAFDEIVALTAKVCGTPCAAFVVLDHERPWFKAAVGRSAEYTAREVALCQHTMVSNDLFEVPDADVDARFSHPASRVRFFAGVPVGLPGAEPLGALCVLHTKPGRLDDTQREALGVFGRSISRALEVLSALKREARARQLAEHSLERADRLATVGSVAASLAHELGTPLAIISGRAKMMAAGSLEPTLISPSAKIIAEQADRMALILRQLMDFARRREPQKAEYDLRLLAAQTALLLDPMARKVGVALVVSNPPEPVFAHCDRGQMSQVLTNLVVNALQASEERGTVELSTGSGLTPYISVKDSGEGIAPDLLPRLFEPFFTTKKSGEGTGLGLSVAHAIVKDHEGTIDVESAPGRGSCFTVRLPR